MSFFVLTREGERVPLDLNLLEQSLTRAAHEAGEADAFVIRSLAEEAAERILPLFETRQEIPSTEIQAIVADALRSKQKEAIAQAYERLHAPLTFVQETITVVDVEYVPVEPTYVSPMPPPTPVISTVGEVHAPRRRRLSEERRAVTHKFRVGDQEGYITVGLYDDGQPGEIFLKMSKEGSVLSGMVDCFATSISICLQYGVPLKVMARKFTNVQFMPNGETENPNIPQAKSIIDYVFRWLALKFLTPEERQSIDAEIEGLNALPVQTSVEESIGRLSL